MTDHRTLSLPEGVAKFPQGLSRRIGTITLTEPRTFTEQFETAAWYRLIACEPQTVPLYSDGYWSSWGFVGTVTSADFTTLYGGVRIGGRNDEREVGKTSTYSTSTYAYGIAERIGTDPDPGTADTTITLDPGYGAAPAYEYIDYDGRTRQGWTLTMPAEGHPLTVTRLRSKPHPVWSFSEPTEHTYEVNYLGYSCGPIDVITDRWTRDVEGLALRAAAELVFTAPAAAEVTA